MAFYRQTAGKQARETVILRADWLSGVARNHAHAHDWHPGGGFLGQREPPAATSDIKGTTRFLDPRTRDGFR